MNTFSHKLLKLTWMSFLSIAFGGLQAADHVNNSKRMRLSDAVGIESQKIETYPAPLTEKYIKIQKELEAVHPHWAPEISELVTKAYSADKGGARSGRPKIVTLFGLPGYGKTTLAQDFVSLLEIDEGTQLHTITLTDNIKNFPMDKINHLGRTPDQPRQIQVLIIEEIQNLSKDSIHTNDSSGDQLWNVLGNGVHIQSPTKKAQDYIFELLSVDLLPLFELDNKIREMQIPNIKTDGFQQAEQNELQVSASAALSELQTKQLKKQAELKEQLKKIQEKSQKDYPGLILPNEIDLLLKEANSEELVFHLFKKAEDRPINSKKLLYDHVFIILTGNPLNIMRDIDSHFYGKQQINPQDLLEYLDSIDLKRMMLQWSKSLIPEKWESRFNTEKWVFQRPLTQEQWQSITTRAIESQLNEMGIEVDGDKNGATDLLLEKYCFPKSGPRLLYDEISRIGVGMGLDICNQRILRKQRINANLRTKDGRIYYLPQGIEHKGIKVSEPEKKVDAPTSDREIQRIGHALTLASFLLGNPLELEGIPLPSALNLEFLELIWNKNTNGTFLELIKFLMLKHAVYPSDVFYNRLMPQQIDKQAHFDFRGSLKKDLYDYFQRYFNQSNKISAAQHLDLGISSNPWGYYLEMVWGSSPSEEKTKIFIDFCIDILNELIVFIFEAERLLSAYIASNRTLPTYQEFMQLMGNYYTQDAEHMILARYIHISSAMEQRIASFQASQIHPMDLVEVADPS